MFLPDLKQLIAGLSTNKITDGTYVLAKILDVGRAYVLAHPERRLNVWQYLKFLRAKHLIQKNYPLAYILGSQEFFGLDFLVNKYTLIPRPDTETLVKAVFEKLITVNCKLRTVLIDVGTGSGCIPIAIMKTCKNGSVEAIATDISRGALRVARKNAKRHGVKIKFLHGNLLEKVIANYSLLLIPYSSVIITANLPYLTKAWFKGEPSIQHEPVTALVSDNDLGLNLYKKFFEQLKLFLSVMNCGMRTVNCELLLEIDPRQSSVALDLISNYFPTAKVEIKKDLGSHDRVMVILISHR